jgi:glycosyltransferase involved in cell wall biosynthesis
MSSAIPSSKLSILHVLTLNGRNGEYGGPVRVARELCTELNRRGHRTHIFSGALEGSIPIQKPGLRESHVVVKPLIKKIPVSSLWNWKLISHLSNAIKNSDVIHIHFARDLIPVLAAFLAILQRKPIITQTHGMVTPDSRTSIRAIDRLLIFRLMNKSMANLVLTSNELESVKKLDLKVPQIVLPNGIEIKWLGIEEATSSKKIVFCSRLNKRKGVDKFIDLAENFHLSELEFEIYGPDGGELKFVETQIRERGLETTIRYCGPLEADKVQEILQKSRLLVLPSENEPFPMVVLEAMAVGTSVLIMPSCGLAPLLKVFDESLVATSESFDGLLESFIKQHQGNFFTNRKNEIIEFCKDGFDIRISAESLECIYRNVIGIQRKYFEKY